MTNQRREALTGYLLISPWLVGFVCVTVGPMLASLALTFTTYDMVTPPRFIGLQNYKFALTVDPLFWSSLWRSVLFVLLDMPMGICLSLLLASLLNQKLRGVRVFRTLFFLPSVTPAVSAIFFWIWLFDPNYGLLNWGLSLIGIRGPGWLGSTTWALPALVIIDLWASVGGTRMIILLAGLQGIPQELYEAAEIDGATIWGKFRNVTLPLLTPAIFFVMVLTTIASLQIFTSAYIGTSGGPGHATWFYTFDVFQQAFQFDHMGYAATLAWIFFVLIFWITYLQFRNQARWVHYEGERQ